MALDMVATENKASFPHTENTVSPLHKNSKFLEHSAVEALCQSSQDHQSSVKRDNL